MAHFAKEATDTNFEIDVLGSDKPVLVDFLGGVVRPLPHDCPDG